MWAVNSNLYGEPKLLAAKIFLLKLVVFMRTLITNCNLVALFFDYNMYNNYVYIPMFNAISGFAMKSTIIYI